jgi:hypothetical protein
MTAKQRETIQAVEMAKPVRPFPLVVNNTGEDISIVMPHIRAFVLGGSLHEDIADLFDIDVIYVDGEKRVIVNWLDDAN